MQIDIATQAGALAAEITRFTDLLAAVDGGAQKGWRPLSIKIGPPDGPAVLELLPTAMATDEITTLVIDTARQFYQATIDALNAQLAAL